MPFSNARDAQDARASAEPANRPGHEVRDAQHAHYPQHPQAGRHIDCGAAEPAPPRDTAPGRGQGSRRFGNGHEGARHVRAPSDGDGRTYR